MDSDEESVINEDELRGKPQNPQQPHPPQGKDHLYLEAARRIGVSPSELRPVTVAQLIAKGMSKESAERKAVLLERSRIVLLGNVEKETRRLCQTRKNINRARPKIDTQESNSFGKGYSIVSEDVISDCDSSDKSDETNEVEENSHPRQKSHGPSFIRKSRVNPAAAAIKKFLKPNTTGKLTRYRRFLFVHRVKRIFPLMFHQILFKKTIHRYLNNGETVTKELTLTDLAKMRMNISKGNITHKLKLSISRKEEDLKAEHDAKERDRERLFECYEQRREEQVKQQKWMQERVERAEQVKQKQEAMKALRDERQRQVEEKHLANDSRRRHVARRRADVMTIRSNATNEQLVQNTSVNQQNKEANDTQFNTRVRDVQKRKYEKERRSVDAIQRRAQICKDTARAHKLHIEATQRRAQRNSSLQKTMQQYKADQDAMRSARWSQASGKANTFLAQQYSEANLHRTSVYQKHRKIESDKRELYVTPSRHRTSPQKLIFIPQSPPPCFACQHGPGLQQLFFALTQITPSGVISSTTCQTNSLRSISRILTALRNVVLTASRIPTKRNRRRRCVRARHRATKKTSSARRRRNALTSTTT